MRIRDLAAARSELWVPTYPRAVETGGVAGEPQACLQALLFGGAPHEVEETPGATYPVGGERSGLWRRDPMSGGQWTS